MGLFNRLANGIEAKATDISALTWEKLLGAPSSKAGVSVNINTALGVTTVLACARVIAEGIAQLPLKIYRDGPGGSKVAAVDHPVYSLLYRQPNSWMTSFEFREMLGFHAVLCGAGRAWIGRAGGKIKELIPLVPERVRPIQSADYEFTYELTTSAGQRYVVPKSEIFEVRGPSWDGVCALDIVRLAREAIGLAIATEETHARLFSNGAQPGGVLSVGSLTPAAAKTLKEDWQAAQADLKNRFKTAVLPGDAKWVPMQMTGVDSQHLPTRQFQIEEICRSMRVFPQMVGYADKTATFASSEAFFLAHVIHGLMPWGQRWEQATWRDLLGGDVALSARLSYQSFLRGDSAARAEYYTAGVVNGWFTRNEVRLWEELNPLDGLDAPLVPLNMGTQAERDAAAKQIAETVKSMIGHNGGPALDGDELEQKIGRVLSAKNEERIRKAKDKLDRVLDTLPQLES